MSAPDEIRQLADRLDHHAEPFEDTANKLGGLGQGHANAAANLRAAAVALRHHADLLDAIGPPMRVMDLMARGTTMDAEGDELAELLSRIYAAAVSPPPAPTTCPECGSDDPGWLADCPVNAVNPWHYRLAT